MGTTIFYSEGNLVKVFTLNLPAFCCTVAWNHPLSLENLALSNHMQVHVEYQRRPITKPPSTVPWSHFAPLDNLETIGNKPLEDLCPQRTF